MVECQVEFALFAVDFRDANVGLRILRIRVHDHLVLLQSSVGLAVAQQVLSEATNGIQVVAVQLNRVPVRLNGVLVFLLLLVRVPERRIELRRTRRVRHRTQHLSRARRVPQLVVEIGQSRDRLFRVRLELHRGLELALRFLQIVVQAIQASQKQVIVHAVGLQADDLLVLLDGQLLRMLSEPLPACMSPSDRR